MDNKTYNIDMIRL